MRVLQNLFCGPIREPRSTRLLRRQIEAQNDLRLTLGSDSVCMPGWIGVSADQIDLVSSASWNAFFQRSSVDAILAEHVWEHLTHEEGKVAARNCFQFLRPGGYLRVAVPDGFHPSQDCIEKICPGGSEVGAEGHKVLYDYLSFAEAFSNAGFRVRLIEYFDSDGVFHANHWDVSKGLIKRTLLFDERNVSQPYAYTSLVLDAFKPDAVAMGATPTPLQALWEDIGDSGAEPSSTGVTSTPLQALGEDIGDPGSGPSSTGITPTPLQALWEDTGDSGAEPSSTGNTPTPLQALWEDTGDSGAEPSSTGITSTPLQTLSEDIGDSGAEPHSTGMTPTPLQALWEDIGDSGAEPYSTDSDFPQQEAA